MRFATRSVFAGGGGLAALLLAQQGGGGGADLSNWPSWLINGGVGGVAIWAIIALINKHAGNIEKVTAEFRAAIALKDQQILDQGDKFAAAIEQQHAENQVMLREMRAEHQKNVEQQFALSREQVAALEHVTAGMNDLKNAVQGLSARVDEIDPRARRTPPKPS